MRPRTFALWLSAGLPCVAYILTASPYAYWLDSGEFVAAAVQLDIAHPPGHPLSALYGKLFSLVPVGSLSLRVALGQAVATAIACALCCRANAAALRGARLDPHVTWALAVLGAWLSAFSYALWFQAVRPEVYALQTLCMAAVYERLMHAASAGRGRGRALLTAALALGLGLTNHHLIALLVAPAFLPELVRVARRGSWHILAVACLLGVLALSTYLYLPLRALREPAMNLGDPSNWERFWWVVSAQVYAHDMGASAAEPMATRMLDVVGLWYEDLGWFPLVLACLGLYLGLRLAIIRRPLVVAALVLVSDAFARAWLGPVRANPDMLGYLAPSYLALGTLCSVCLGAVAWSWKQRHPATWARARAGVWIVPFCVLVLVPKGAARASLARFSATDTLDELRARQLPARGVVVESTPQTVFRRLELSAVEGARPDLVHVPLPFLRYPSAASRLIAAHPELSTLVADFMHQHDRLKNAAALGALARTQPVLIELDTRVDPSLYPLLSPAGVYARLGTKLAEGALEDFYATLRRELGQQQHEPETARQLLWIHYMNAVVLGARDQRQLARAALAQAYQLQPTEQRLPALRAALNAARPFDARAFLEF